MSRQAQVGAFAIFALLLLFGVFYVITDLGTRYSGYRVGVHFNSAAGLTTGAIVYFSGVTAGSVDSIQLLPDNTVDVVLAINRDVDIPRDSKFLIQAPLTGSPNLLIVPPTPAPRPSGVLGPTPAPGAVAMLEHRVLPIEEQPQGTNTATVADLLEQGQGQIRRFDKLLADLQAREPKMLDTLQATLTNANQLTVTAQQIATSMQSSLNQASTNVVDLTNSLDRTVNANSSRINHIMGQVDETSASLNKSTRALQELATNREFKGSILSTTKNIAQTTQTLADLTKDLRSVTGDPQTQAQMRDTVANLDATMQRTSSLLGELGGTSSVYGVDAGATPAPLTVPNATPYPNPSGTLSPHTRGEMRAKLGNALRNLVAIQLRVSALSRQTACCTNPILSKDRGPQTDLNAIVFPGGHISGLVGANDIGYATTWNFALMQSMGRGLRFGGGILYSRLGILGQYNTPHYGIEGRLYDPRHPMLDLYGNLNLAAGMRMFFGERDLTRAERRTVYGLQLQF